MVIIARLYYQTVEYSKTPNTAAKRRYANRFQIIKLYYDYSLLVEITDYRQGFAFDIPLPLSIL